MSHPRLQNRDCGLRNQLGQEPTPPSPKMQLPVRGLVLRGNLGGVGGRLLATVVFCNRHNCGNCTLPTATLPAVTTLDFDCALLPSSVLESGGGRWAAGLDLASFVSLG